MKKTMSFIGGGRITNIFLQAFTNKNISLKQTRIFDTDTKTAGELKAKFPDITLTHLEETASADIIFIALHPPAIPDTLNSLKDQIKPESIIISLAPKISSDQIGSVLENENIVRMIPNASSVINKGYNPVWFSPDCKDKQETWELLALLGKTFETEEKKLEAYAIASAMLATYFWFQWDEMISVSKAIGLSDEESRETIKESLLTAIETMFDSGLSMEQVFDLIPVKPIGEHEDEIRGILHSKLTALHQKIKS